MLYIFLFSTEFIYLFILNRALGLTGIHWTKVRNLRKVAETVLLSSYNLLSVGNQASAVQRYISHWAFLLKNVGKQNWVKNKFSLGTAKFLSVVFMIHLSRRHTEAMVMCHSCSTEDTVIRHPHSTQKTLWPLTRKE